MSAMCPEARVEALDGRARKLTTPSGDGRMVWRVWGRGAPLILFHGGSGSWTHWLRNIEVLEQHFELWIPDLPGLGQSAMPPEPWTPASIANVLVAGLPDILDPDIELRIAGFSFGGHIAGLTAQRLGARVRDLTLIGVAGLGLRADPREPFAKERPGMSAEQLYEVHRKNLEILMIADPAKIDPLAVHLQTWNAQHARFRSRPFAPTDELARALEHVPATLKTIWGTRDVIARPSVDLRLEILRRHHPELAVRLIEGAGHWVMYEAADAFNAAFLDLLAL
ncbi:MAG: alpha/beta fold hydrolase [Hyphomicrobiales bacterium]|nr:MAG: alpha/beta fold hydrolase [Hyphomicrobiales bacterium]